MPGRLRQCLLCGESTRHIKRHLEGRHKGSNVPLLLRQHGCRTRASPKKKQAPAADVTHPAEVVPTPTPIPQAPAQDVRHPAEVMPTPTPPLATSEDDEVFDPRPDSPEGMDSMMPEAPSFWGTYESYLKAFSGEAQSASFSRSRVSDDDYFPLSCFRSLFEY